MPRRAVCYDVRRKASSFIVVSRREKFGNRPEGAEAIGPVRAALVSADDRRARPCARRPGNPYRRRQASCEITKRFIASRAPVPNGIALPLLPGFGNPFRFPARKHHATRANRLPLQRFRPVEGWSGIASRAHDDRTIGNQNTFGCLIPSAVDPDSGSDGQ